MLLSAPAPSKLARQATNVRASLLKLVPHWYLGALSPQASAIHNHHICRPFTKGERGDSNPSTALAVLHTKRFGPS